MTTPTNPNVVYSTTPIIGVGLNRRTNSTTETNPIEHALGETVIDNSGKVWVYVHAIAAIASNNYVTLSWGALNGGSVDAASVALKTVMSYINGTAAFAAGDYGWVQSVRRLGTFPPAAYTGSGP